MSCSSTITSIDPDPELDPLLQRGARVAIGHAPLHLDGAPDGLNHARELGKEAVPGVLHDPAPVFGDLRLDQVPEVSLQAFVCPLLIHPHQARIPRHVGGKDRNEAADSGHVSPGEVR
jgi:hypothetical protein